MIQKGSLDGSYGRKEVFFNWNCWTEGRTALDKVRREENGAGGGGGGGDGRGGERDIYVEVCFNIFLKTILKFIQKRREEGCWSA